MPTITGPLRIVEGPGIAAFGAIPASVDDQTVGTPDTVDFTINNVGIVVTGVDGTGNNAASNDDWNARAVTFNNNMATLVTLVTRIRRRFEAGSRANVTTPGTQMSSPISVVVEPPLAAYAALPVAVDDQTLGSVAPDWAIGDSGIPLTGVDGSGNNAASLVDSNARLATTNHNFATLAALLNRILARLTDDQYTARTTFTGPLSFEAVPGLAALTVLTNDAGALDDQTGGTADTVDFTFETLNGLTGVDGTGNNAAEKTAIDGRLNGMNNRVATVVAALDGILERLVT